MFSADYSNSGPYPKSDRNDELQELSFKAFDAALPVDRFIFRPEPKDKGADGSVELKRDSGCTNMRAQVQLKGTDSDLVNLDGTVSVQIKTSNLRYLLNGLSPLYGLYVVPRDELRYLWARDECKRLDQSSPTWRQQEKVTIHFVRLLTPAALDEIYDQIQKEARLHRKIHDSLAVAGLNEEIVVAIDRETLETTDSAEIERRLLKSGLTIVSCGYASLVLKQAQLLTPEAVSSPRIQMILAYANFSIARYQAALGHLQQTNLRRTELSPDDQQFLLFLRNVCDYQSGRIDLAEYQSRLAEWEQKDRSGFALAQRLDCLRHELLQEMNKVKREELVEELRDVATEILNCTDESDASKLQARLVLLHAEGGQVVASTIHELFRIQIRTGLRVPVDIRKTFAMLQTSWAAWQEKLFDALNDCNSLGNPLLVAFALDSLATIETVCLMNVHLFGMQHGWSRALPDEPIEMARTHAKQSREIFKQANHLEGELCSKMIIADLCLLAGQQDPAKAIARDILPQAEAMEYSSLVERANEHLSGRSILSQLEGQVVQSRTEDMDFKLGNAPDDEMRAFAEDISVELKLHADRPHILERECLSSRDIAKERLQWCRYLELHQDLTGSENPSAYYQRDHDRVCRCEKHGYKSAFGNPDWQPVIAAFKGAYCKGCPDRTPKIAAP